jgi:hypothetical protein
VTNNWWVAYGQQNTPIGYWPREIFHFMKDKCDFAFWGGVVQGPTASLDSPQMGSGHFAHEGYGKAACIGYIQVVNNNNKLVTLNQNKAFPSTSDIYKYSVGGYKVDNNGMHIFYGGPGVIV